MTVPSALSCKERLILSSPWVCDPPLAMKMLPPLPQPREFHRHALPAAAPFS